MLSPSNRSLYTDALTPPAGFSLDRAVAATFSMDLSTLLSVPLQLVLQSTEDRDELMKDPIALYEALQRATRRVHVFAQQGRIQAPRHQHLLYSLLEPMITEVVAPAGGAFHPKLWLLRFVEEQGTDVNYRLMLPSKNLTTDRAWDAALTLDGIPGEGDDTNGVTIAEFIARLPELAVNPFSPSTEFTLFLTQLRQIVWEIPDGFDELKFHIFGFGGRRWRPKKNKRLAVISPFVGKKALEVLAKTSDMPLALVSRSESLAEMGSAGPFRSAYILHDAAETEDGEDHQGVSSEIGLHAKIFVYQIGNRTHIALGSANATDAALIAGRNIEILAELAGPTNRVGAVKRLFDPDVDDGLGQYLVPWSPDDDYLADSAKKASQKVLEELRSAILSAKQTLHCRKDGEDWTMELKATTPIAFDSESTAMAWPVTVGMERAVDLRPLGQAQTVTLPVQAMASLTSLVAFKLSNGRENIAFALNLPVTGMPEERDRAILRSVIQNRDGFLRYLLMLLAGLGDGADVGTVARALNHGASNQAASNFDDVPLLEELVRAFSREPKRLRKIERLIHDITRDGEAEQILPAGFLSLWLVFAEAMTRHER